MTKLFDKRLFNTQYNSSMYICYLIHNIAYSIIQNLDHWGWWRPLIMVTINDIYVDGDK